MYYSIKRPYRSFFIREERLKKNTEAVISPPMIKIVAIRAAKMMPMVAPVSNPPGAASESGSKPCSVTIKM